MERSKVAVVILNWNGEKHLRRFLTPVVENSASTKGVEIVVADNGSVDGSVEYVRQTFPAVRLIELDRNHGYTNGYNMALSQIDAEYYLLLNSDVEVTPGWIEPLAGILDNDPQVAAVSPKILSLADRGSFEYAGASGGFIDVLGYPFCRGRILSSLERDNGQYDDARDTFWTSGACMLIRSGVFHSLGGFDEKFFAHMEEIDLCWRMHIMGFRTMVAPRSVVYHLGGGTLPNNSPRKLYLNYRNNLAMLYKNAPKHLRRRTLLVRMFLDLASAGVYLFSGRFAFAASVIRAHNDYNKWKPELRRQRIYQDNPKVANIFGGSIVLRYFCGMRKFPADPARFSE